MQKRAVIAAAALALLPLAASAGEVENRVHDQNARIDQGVAGRTLSYDQYHRLHDRLDSIQAQRNHDLRTNDGHLTGSEYRQLNHEENNLSQRISWDKHT